MELYNQECIFPSTVSVHSLWTPNEETTEGIGIGLKLKQLLPLFTFGVLFLIPSSAGADLTEPVVDSIYVESTLPVSSPKLLNGTGLEIGVSILRITPAQVREGVVANLCSMGFLEPAVKVNWPLWDDEINIVRIEVQPGTRSTLSGLVFNGNTLFTADSLAQFYPVDPGDPITPEDTLTFRNRVISAYNRRGYIYSRVNLRLLDFGSSRNEESDRALECSVSEGRQAFLSSVSVSGLETVRRKVVTRELLIQSGDSLNMELLRQSISSIYQLGLFRDVRFSYVPLSGDSSLVDLSITVNETDYRRVDIGTGYVSPSAVFGSVSWLHPNIMGNNQTLRAGISMLEYIGSREGRRIEPEITYQEPWFLSSRWRWQLKLSYLYLFTPAIRQRSYSITSTFVRDITRHLEFSGAYSLEYEKYNEWEEDQEFTDNDWRTTSSITTSLIHDTRHPVLDPMGGHRMMGEAKLSGGVLGGRDYYRLRGEVRLFRQLGSSLVLAGRLRLGGAFPYGDDTTIPPDDRFFLGGGTTVRGYPLNSLGPEDDEGNPLGGRIEILGNFEARVKIVGNLGAVLFTDAGGLWTSLEEISFGSAGFGTGFGLRYHTVFGPIRLDYGFAPTWRNSLKRGKIYLGIGHTF